MGAARGVVLRIGGVVPAAATSDEDAGREHSQRQSQCQCTLHSAGMLATRSRASATGARRSDGSQRDEHQASDTPATRADARRAGLRRAPRLGARGLLHRPVHGHPRPRASSTSRCRRSSSASASLRPSCQWVIDAYAITFAGFLLLAGRMADHFGQRRLFVVALALFALASLVGGLAPDRGAPDRRARASRASPAR